MYLLANEDEIKFDKDGNTKPPSGRAYKIQIEVEAIYTTKEKKGKIFLCSIRYIYNKSCSITQGKKMK